MRASIEELLFAFPDTPVPFRLPSEPLATFETSLLPFELPPAQSAYPRAFVSSNFVCDSVLTPALTEWFEWCRMQQSRGSNLNLVLTSLLIEHSQKRTSLWVSSRNSQGFSDIASAFSAFLAWNTFEVGELDGHLNPDFRSLVSHDTAQVISGRRWLKVKRQDRFSAEAILADQPSSRFTGDISNLTLQAILVFTAPEIAPNAVLEAISICAGTLVIDCDNDGLAEAKVTGTAAQITGATPARAIWWLVYMWRRMSELKVRMGILTTSEGTVILYMKDGFVQVTKLLHHGQACASRPLESTIPLFLAIQLLSGAPFRLPPELTSPETDKTSRANPPALWKLMDVLEINNRLAGQQYPYRPCLEEPGEDMVDFAWSTDVKAHSEDTENLGGEDSRLGELSPLMKASPVMLGMPSVCVRVDPMLPVGLLSSEPLGPLLNCSLLLFGPIRTHQLIERRVPQLQDGFEIIPSSFPRYVRPQLLIIKEKAGQGSLWTCVTIAAPSSGPPLRFPTVAKISFPELIDTDDTIQQYKECGISLPLRDIARTAREAIAKEFANLHILRELQGTVVPRVAGMYGGLANGREVWMLFLEDVGPEVEGDSPDKFFEADKREILDKYRRLHEAGIIHGDVATRHWRRHASATKEEESIRIIDFDHSTARTDVDPETFERMIETEMREVQYFFDREESTALPVVRRRRKRFLCF